MAKVEEGKRYVLRNKDVTGPLVYKEEDHWSDHCWFDPTVTKLSWYSDGYFHFGGNFSDIDIAQEYKE